MIKNKKNRFIIIAFISCLFSLQAINDCKAQQSTRVLGSIKDSLTNDNLSFVTISLISDGKNTKSFTTDSKGHFETYFDTGSDFQLKFTLLGYAAKVFELKLIPRDKSGDILMEVKLAERPKELNGVQIAERRALVRQSVDRITYDVKNDPDQSKSTTLEILQKVPLISVGFNDEIEVNGRKTYTILINGKPSSILNKDPATALKNLAAGSVDKIEVITTPNSRFKQSGVNEVINITTSVSHFQGLEATARASYNTLDYSNGNLTGEYKSGKFGLSNYGIFLRTAYPQKESLAEIISADSRVTQRGTTLQRTNLFNDIPEISFELDSLSTLLASVEYSHLSSNTLDNSKEYSNNAANVASNSEFTTMSDLLNTNLAYNFYYQHQGQKVKDRTLVLGYRFTKPTSVRNDTILNSALGTANRHVQVNRTTDQEQTAQADYSHPLKDWLIEAGAKEIMRRSFSLGDYYTYNGSLNSYTNAPTSSAPLDNNQNVFSVYNSYYVKRATWGLRFGGRYEYARLKNSQYENSFNNVIPTLSYQLKVNRDLASFSYDQSIERPALWQLNTFLSSGNPNFILQGNPSLSPSTTHQFEASYSFNRDNFYKITGYYYYTKNGINGISSAVNDTTVFFTYKNVGKKDDIGLKSNVNYKLKKGMNLSFNSRVSYVAYHSPTGDPNLTNHGVEFFTATKLRYHERLQVQLLHEGVQSVYRATGKGLLVDRPVFEHKQEVRK